VNAEGREAALGHAEERLKSEIIQEAMAKIPEGAH